MHGAYCMHAQGFGYAGYVRLIQTSLKSEIALGVDQMHVECVRVEK